jgi:anti-anti-sigma factor
MDEAQMATVVYGTLDPTDQSFCFVAAGHPPPLLIRADGSASFLEGGRSAPLGVLDEEPEDSTVKLGQGSTILLYTDGLVERHRGSIEEGMWVLKQVAEGHRGDLESLCDLLIGQLVGPFGADDDIAVLAIRLTPISSEPLRLSMPAQPEALVTIRRVLGQWLGKLDATPEEIADFILACNEAAANVVEHAYGAEEGLVEVDAVCVEREVEVTVRDFGRWRSPRGTEQGRGLQMMKALLDTVEVQRKSVGSEVHLIRALGRRVEASDQPLEGESDLEVGSEKLPEVEVVHLEGDIDLSNAESVAADLARAVDNERLGLVVDLSDISYLDSAGLRILFHLAARLERHRQQLLLVVPEESPIRRALSLTEFETSAPIATSVEAAVAEIQATLGPPNRAYGNQR